MTNYFHLTTIYQQWIIWHQYVGYRAELCEWIIPGTLRLDD